MLINSAWRWLLVMPTSSSFIGVLCVFRFRGGAGAARRDVVCTKIFFMFGIMSYVLLIDTWELVNTGTYVKNNYCSERKEFVLCNSGIVLGILPPPIRFSLRVYSMTR